jgi:succinyl-diaminopimelate desuccinylase
VSGETAERLANRTLALVNIASESRNEAEIAGYVASAMPWEPTWRQDETLWYDAGAGDRPLVVLAGHLDTVPAQGNLPGRIEDGRVLGLGASDMKAGVAEMVELALWWADLGTSATAVDLGFVYFGREEIAVEESPLPALFATGLLDRAALVIVLEPTDNEIHAGCVGSIVARASFEGESAHAARPWTGVNAIGLAVEALAPLVALEPVDIENGGLTFREVVTVTRIEGGVADNVVPARASATLNFRYAPGRSRAEAEERLRALAGDVEILSHSSAAPVPALNQLLEQLRSAGRFALAPKQAWTPVAQFAERGLDAVNLGPGATRYAHRVDEQVEIAELARTFEALTAFARGSV